MFNEIVLGTDVTLLLNSTFHVDLVRVVMRGYVLWGIDSPVNIFLRVAIACLGRIAYMEISPEVELALLDSWRFLVEVALLEFRLGIGLILLMLCIALIVVHSLLMDVDVMLEFIWVVGVSMLGTNDLRSIHYDKYGPLARRMDAITASKASLMDVEMNQQVGDADRMRQE